MMHKSGVTLLYLLMICSKMIFLHATPPADFKQVMDEDHRECLRQIEFAYKSDSCTGCFSYAVEHYVKGEYISVRQSIPSTSDQSQNIASTSDQSQNIASVSNQSFIGLTFDGGQGDTDFEDLSQYIGDFHGLEDFIKKDFQNNVQRLDGQSTGYEDPLVVADSFINYEGNDSQPIEQEDPLVVADSFINYEGNDSQPIEQDDKNQYHSNYAMEYYKELESMVQGNNVMPPLPYCRINFPRDNNCYVTLSKFGTDSKSAKFAVRLALTKYKLITCYDHYTKSYMTHIINDILIISPSKSPKEFCQEILQGSEWYLQLKGNYM